MHYDIKHTLNNIKAFEGDVKILLQQISEIGGIQVVLDLQPHLRLERLSLSDLIVK